MAAAAKINEEKWDENPGTWESQKREKTKKIDDEKRRRKKRQVPAVLEEFLGRVTNVCSRKEMVPGRLTGVGNGYHGSHHIRGARVRKSRKARCTGVGGLVTDHFGFLVHGCFV